MKKPTASSETPSQGPARARARAEQKAAIKAALESLDALQPATPRAAGLLALLRSWLSDESGYDERTWPKLKKALDEERDRVEARRLFDD
ncbi:MAG TPA: hypothetical protein VKA46_23390 [Gemmataceae bacterium]|nr:hypothetical protein [Gemmataceae bacterium]